MSKALGMVASLAVAWGSAIGPTWPSWVRATPVDAAEPCVAISGASLGALPLEISLGEQVIRFTEWTYADALSSEVVGFAVAEAPSRVTFEIEAGDRSFEAHGPRFVHPLGVSGPRVHGIDAVRVCLKSR